MCETSMISGGVGGSFRLIGHGAIDGVLGLMDLTCPSSPGTSFRKGSVLFIPYMAKNSALTDAVL